MLSLFLQESSIHGLRYLVQSKHWLAKIVWLICVTACVVCAGIIIYFNILNWNNSPAVVTSVNPALVKNKVAFPMITVCPHQVNHNALFFNLINNNVNLVNDSYIQELENILLNIYIGEIFKQRKPKTSRIHEKANKVFEKCNEEENKEEAACKFALLLTAIAKEIGSKDVDLETIHKYVYDTVVSGVKPTLQSLQEFVEKKHDISLGDDFTMPRYRLDHQRMQKGYIYFFPLFEDADEEVLAELKPIDEYEAYRFKITKEDLASVLSYLNDMKAMESYNDLSRIISKIVLDILPKYLYESDHKEATDLVNYHIYSYKGDDYTRLLFPATVPNRPTTLPCGELIDTVDQICKTNKNETCQEYCGKIKKAADKMDKIINILNYSSYTFGVPQFGNAESLLPTCKHFDGDVTKDSCWTQIVTDKGICFASNNGGLSSLIPGIGPKNSFQFSLDRGSQYYFRLVYDKYVNPMQLFELRVTPPGDYAVGELSEEAKIMKTYAEGQTLWYTWLIKVTIDQTIITSDEFRGMAPHKRNCYYDNEVALDYFPIYSEPNCALECAWNHARTQCSCVPWFLKEVFPDDIVCELYGNFCFKRLIDERYDLVEMDCGCLPDCNKENYKVEFGTESRNFRDPDKQAVVDDSLIYNYVMFDKGNNTKQEIVEMVHKIKLPFDDHVGLIKLFVEQRTTLQIMMTATVTAIDMISNIGGTLGLFCGFSILSGVEILYWMGKWATGNK